MKHKVLMTLPFISLILTSCNGVPLNVPKFEKTKGVRFTAYSGPTVKGWVTNGMVPTTLTDENMAKLAEAGFNKIIALYEGGSNAGGADTYELIKNRSVKAEQDALIGVELAAKYNIKYCVRDWSFYGLVKNYTSDTYNPRILTDEQYEQIINDMFDDDNPYIHSPGYGGNFCHDEPFYEELERIAAQVRYYNAAMERQGVDAEPIINLFPSTVSHVSDNPELDYSDYIDEYMRCIAPQVGYISFDFYPFIKNFYDGSYIRNTYLYNLALVATKVKEQREKGNDIEMRTFLQSVGNWTGMRDMVSVGDFRFQVSCEMAFGSHEFAYYEYANVYSEEEGGFALFNLKTNEYNRSYEWAKIVNNEVHNFEDAYLAYTWDGVMYKNADEMYENQAFDMISDLAMEKHPRVKIKTCEQDCFMGTFKNDKGDDAFMLVNYTDPYHHLNNKVKLHFNNAKGLLMYRYGQKMVVNLPMSGDYTIDLYPGEGRFIIPIK